MNRSLLLEPCFNPFYINVNAYANAQLYTHTAEVIKHTPKNLSKLFIFNPFYGEFSIAHIKSAPIPKPIAIDTTCSKNDCSFLFFMF